MPDAGPDPSWVADPTIAWRILLGAELVAPLDVATARARLATLHAAQGWPGTGHVVVGDDPAVLRRDLGDLRDGTVALGLVGDGREVVVAAHHAAVDGLGLLAVLAAVTSSPVTSAARGVGDRPDGAGPLGTVVRRLVEVAATPPARIVTPPGAGAAGDVYVARDLAGEVRTAELVVAATRGVAAHNRARGRAHRTRHVAIAVGVARENVAEPIADRSALLRLRDAERLDLPAVTAALRQAPTQRPPDASGGRSIGSGLARQGMRVLAPRLGSTVLVSHLGRVDAAMAQALTFFPVTAGGTGVSLGAVTLAGGSTTRVTLRARGSRWTHDGLEQLLEAVVDAVR